MVGEKISQPKYQRQFRGLPRTGNRLDTSLAAVRRPRCWQLESMGLVGIWWVPISEKVVGWRGERAGSYEDEEIGAELRWEAKEKGERVRKVKKPGRGSDLSGLGRLENVAYKEE
jgi:hypothetical protein